MGGKQSTNDQNVLIGKDTLIVLNSEKARTLKLTHILRFPHGFDGLRIWQAGIVLARYAILHREVFQDKFVMELGSGTGIAGIAVLKFTSCKNCLLSDYLPEVVENARRNCLKNNMNKAVVMKLNWKDYQSFNNRYDIIIGSDVIAPGAPTKQVYHLLEKFLVPGGIALFVGPKKAGYIESLLCHVDPKVFDVESLELIGENYYESPMPNKLEGYESFPGLTTEIYILHTLRKRIQEVVSIPLTQVPNVPLRDSHAEPTLTHYERERVMTQFIPHIKPEPVQVEIIQQQEIPKVLEQSPVEPAVERPQQVEPEKVEQPKFQEQIKEVIQKPLEQSKQDIPKLAEEESKPDPPSEQPLAAKPSDGPEVDTQNQPAAQITSQPQSKPTQQIVQPASQPSQEIKTEIHPEAASQPSQQTDAIAPETTLDEQPTHTEDLNQQTPQQIVQQVTVQSEEPRVESEQPEQVELEPPTIPKQPQIETAILPAPEQGDKVQETNPSTQTPVDLHPEVETEPVAEEPMASERQSDV